VALSVVNEGRVPIMGFSPRGARGKRDLFFRVQSAGGGRVGGRFFYRTFGPRNSAGRAKLSRERAVNRLRIRTAVVLFSELAQGSVAGLLEGAGATVQMPG